MTQTTSRTPTAALVAQASITADGIDAFGAWARGDRASRDAVHVAEQSASSCRHELERTISDGEHAPIPTEDLLALSSELDRLLSQVAGLMRETEALEISPSDLELGEMVEHALQGVHHLRRAFEALDRESGATEVVTTAAEPADDGPRLAHIRSLDGLRGLAVLVVVLFHFSPSILPGGFLGVDLFFVLSGFLITSLLVTEWDATSRIGLGAFWARRARRLLPAMLLVLASVGIYALLYTDAVGGRAVAEDGLASFLYVANWHFIDVGQNYVQHVLHQDLSPLRHMWSLAIEEQFYLVWPLIVAGIGLLVTKTGGRDRGWTLRNAVGGLSVALAVASVARMITLYDAANPDRVYYGTDTRAHLLLFGAAVGAFTAGAPIAKSSLARRFLVWLGSLLGVGLVALMTFTTTADEWLYRGGYAVIGLAMILVLVAAAQPGRHLLRRVLETRGLVALGLISYGVYLWHWPIFILLTEARTELDGPILFVARAAATLVLAIASYYLVEIPIRRQRLLARSPRAPGLRPMPVTLVSTVAAFLLVPALTLPAFIDAPTSKGHVKATTVAAAYAQAPRCDTTGPKSDELRGVRLLLVGNSVAKEIYGCLKQTLRHYGASVTSIADNLLVPCQFPDRLSEQLSKPASARPNAVMFFSLSIYVGCTNKLNEYSQIEGLVAQWEKGDTQTYLVPYVPTPADAAGRAPAVDPLGVNHRDLAFDWNGTQAKLDTFYRSLAAKQPDRVSVLDPGVFLRDDTGTYEWRMPCASDREPGCDGDGTILVRFPGDGLHFCADPAWIGETCGVKNEGGARRVTAALVQQILASPPASVHSST